MILGAHQPDLLPWSGFWNKMWRSTVFDLAVFDQFVPRSYHRRVTMRGSWVSLPVARPARGRICDVELAPDAVSVLWAAVEGRYRGARYWRERSGAVREVVDGAAEVSSRWLWLFNASLIVGVRDLLGIRTPVAVGCAPRGAGLEGLLDVADQYDATTYLSGEGGRAYMGDDPEGAFTAAGRSLCWTRHDPLSGDSILTAVFDHEDPMDVVRRESTPEGWVR